MRGYFSEYSPIHRLGNSRVSGEHPEQVEYLHPAQHKARLCRLIREDLGFPDEPD